MTPTFEAKEKPKAARPDKEQPPLFERLEAALAGVAPHDRGLLSTPPAGVALADAVP